MIEISPLCDVSFLPSEPVRVLVSYLTMASSTYFHHGEFIFLVFYLCSFIDFDQSFDIFIKGLLMAINANTLESIPDELDLLRWSGVL